MTKQLRREFLLLADTYKADKHDPIGMLMSEKLDGARCFWDGGISRGDDTVNVPWANIFDPKKPSERKAKIKPKATGLWSRYGNPIMAPEWFLDALPPEPLDGELYIDRGMFQRTMSIIRKDVPVDEEWREIKYVAFGAPALASVFQTGLIKNPQFVRPLDINECIAYTKSRGFGYDPFERLFSEELDVLNELFVRYTDGGIFDIVDQTVCKSYEQLDERLKAVKAVGGEGLMLRDTEATWFPKRRPLLLKVKPRHDAECTITGFFAGEKGKTGHLLGKLGGFHCVWHGDPTAPCGLLKAPVTFKIGSGLNYQDRELDPVELFETACENPGADLDCVETGQFSVGDRITFSYMDVSKDNVPREPTYLRKRSDV